ncbi:MAG: hypothetical protein LBB75_01390, partial [Oscillospiraceae bacterium]|nr:hypothetical protein [Oscillospiraceae bacterium]
TGLPLVHLDALYWRPNLQRPPDEEWAREHRELIAEEKWILDGNYIQGGAMEARCAVADLVIYLDVNRLVCLISAVLRNFKTRADDGPQDFQEKWDKKFFGLCKAIWDYPQERRPKYLALCKNSTPFYAIKGRREMHRLLRQWAAQSGIHTP